MSYFCDEQSEERGEERSDEWKVVSYIERRYNVFAVASIQPSLLVRSHLALGTPELSFLILLVFEIVPAMPKRFRTVLGFRIVEELR